MTRTPKIKKDTPAKITATTSTSTEGISTYFKKLSTHSATDVSPEQIRKRKRQSAMHGEISPITSVDNLVLDDSEDMDTGKPEMINTATEISSADAVLVATDK